MHLKSFIDEESRLIKMKKELVCMQCGKEFVFDQSEQEMYLQLGFSSEPKRCEVCRGAEKALKSAVKPEKEMYMAICDGCGKETQLPFKPKGDKPVYCRECFLTRKKKSNDRSGI